MASVWFALDQTTGVSVTPNDADVGRLALLPNLSGAANDNGSVSNISVNSSVVS
ncbi:MAG: hypothetical protein AAF205_12125 [Pseudomonadota bacterium]